MQEDKPTAIPITNKRFITQFSLPKNKIKKLIMYIRNHLNNMSLYFFNTYFRINLCPLRYIQKCEKSLLRDVQQFSDLKLIMYIRNHLNNMSLYFFNTYFRINLCPLRYIQKCEKSLLRDVQQFSP